MIMENFISLFNFRKECELLIGLEQEFFLADSNDNIAPISPSVLNELGKSERFGYEFSACQLEERVGPCMLENLESELEINEQIIKKVEEKIGFKRVRTEVASDDMPLDIYPDSTGRYQKIAKSMSRQKLLAACQVAGTHVHVGMPDFKTALKVYNKVIGRTNELCGLSNGLNVKRLGIYQIVAPDFYPPRYESEEMFHVYAVENNFDTNPRNCWHIIRISVHGTIEFRMFGVSGNHKTIKSWATYCHDLCKSAM